MGILIRQEESWGRGVAAFHWEEDPFTIPDCSSGFLLQRGSCKRVFWITDWLSLGYVAGGDGQARGRFSQLVTDWRSRSDVRFQLRRLKLVK